MAHDQTQQPQQPQESMLSTALWTGGALLVVLVVAVYVAM
jgi:hypothetical protein